MQNLFASFFCYTFYHFVLYSYWRGPSVKITPFSRASFKCTWTQVHIREHRKWESTVFWRAISTFCHLNLNKSILKRLVWFIPFRCCCQLHNYPSIIFLLFVFTSYITTKNQMKHCIDQNLQLSGKHRLATRNLCNLTKNLSNWTNIRWRKKACGISVDHQWPSFEPLAHNVDQILIPLESAHTCSKIAGGKKLHLHHSRSI